MKGGEGAEAAKGFRDAARAALVILAVEALRDRSRRGFSRIAARPAKIIDHGTQVCRKFRVRVITMAKKETSYGETEATSYFRRAA